MSARFTLLSAALLFVSACGTTGAAPIQVVISGEEFATSGYAFPATSDTQPAFVDGWELHYESVVASVSEVTLSENPDLSPTDQSKTGAAVAKLTGPWLVDLAQAGPLTAKEQNGSAWLLGSLANQNLNGNKAFDPTARYAFGFTTVVPQDGATQVNTIDPTTLATMKAKGFTVFLKGTAVFKGTGCRQSVAGYDFGRLPTTVHFAFGFKAPTTYVNCINPELQPDGTRGVQGQAGTTTTAQVTLHLDHPFWEALQEDAPLRWDLIAARKSTATAPAPEATVTEADLSGVSFEAATDAQGTPLPWRYCTPAQTSDRTAGTVSYDPHGVPVSQAGGASGLADLLDYMTYNLSTFGHLNNDGLCHPARSFPAPQ
jgi:hypothetical protein